MSTKLIPTTFLFIVLVFAGCNFSTRFEHSTEVRLESINEVFSTSEQAELVLVNDTDSDVYLNYCGSDLIHHLEIKESGGFKLHSGGLCLALYTPGFVRDLEPGQSNVMAFTGLEAGRYRYRLEYKMGSSQARTREVSIEFLVE